MKKFKRLLSVMLVIVCFVCFAAVTACGEDEPDDVGGAKLASITITTPPDKTEYTEGESFDKTGMVVTAKYTDNETSEVTDYTVTPDGALTKDVTKVTVTYKEGNNTRTAEQNITVRADSAFVELEVLARPVKVDYMVGDMLDLKDLTLLVKYADGSSKEIKSGYVCEQLDKPLTVEDDKITVSYTEKGVTKSAKFNIEVLEPYVLDTIEITKQPTTTAYAEGDVFNPAGMEVTANYTNGKSRTVSKYTYPEAGFSKDDTKITISYTEEGITKTADVAITITKYLQSITASGTCPAYKVGDTLKTDWITVTGNYSDGSTVNFENFTVSKTGKLALTDNGTELEVTVGTMKSSVTLNVTDYTGTPFKMGIEGADQTQIDGSSSEEAKAFVTEYKYKGGLNNNVDGVAFRFKSSAAQKVRVEVVMAANEAGDMLLKDIFDVSLGGIRLGEEVEVNVPNPNKIAYFYFQKITFAINVVEGDNTLRFVSHGGAGTNLAGVILTPEDDTKTVGAMTTPIYRIECEWAKLSGTVSDGGKSFIMANKPNNSNNRTLGFFGGDAKLEFDLTSDRATTAKFTLCCASTFGGAAGNQEKMLKDAWRIKINGVESENYKNVKIVPSDWAKQPVQGDATPWYNDFVVVEFEIELVEGANTITMEFVTGGGDLDYIELTTEAVIEYTKVDNPDR